MPFLMRQLIWQNAISEVTSTLHILYISSNSWNIAPDFESMTRLDSLDVGTLVTDLLLRHLESARSQLLRHCLHTAVTFSLALGWLGHRLVSQYLRTTPPVHSSHLNTWNGNKSTSISVQEVILNLNKSDVFNLYFISPDFQHKPCMLCLLSSMASIFNFCLIYCGCLSIIILIYKCT